MYLSNLEVKFVGENESDILTFYVNFVMSKIFQFPLSSALNAINNSVNILKEGHIKNQCCSEYFPLEEHQVVSIYKLKKGNSL